MKNYMKYLSLLSASLLLAACGDQAVDETADDATVEDTEQVEEVETEETTEETEQEEEVADDQAEDETEDTAGDEVALEGNALKYSYGAPHGNMSFGVTFVGLEDDTVTHAFIDEFQFMEGDEWEGVPNSDGAFAEGYDEGLTLISKVENDEAYSDMMIELSDATMSLGEGYQAIADFAEGKTITEIEEAIDELNNLDDDQEISDVVTGATLVDTSGYLQEIVDTAKDGFSYEVDGDIAGADFSYALEAPHGDRAFAIVSVLTDGDLVLASAQDEFQFMEGDEWEGVPNSDAEFGEAYAEGNVLVSKFENDQAYSDLMAENSDSEVTYVNNMNAILDFAQGMTLAEIEEAISELEGQGEDEEVADVVSGATFVDTDGYLQAVVNAANN